MDEGRPSRTALAVAAERALHQVLDTPRVFEDPLALKILGRSEAEVLASSDSARRVRRLFFAARSRFTEDSLAEAFRRGVRQYVVLGAGLDTFAYRNPHRGLRVFEVDHPATQMWKRRCLAHAEIAVPPSTTFVPIDFEHQTLAEGLAQAGFNGNESAFFSWLGVTIYLTRDAVYSTLGFVASVTGEIVFDYGESSEAMAPVRRAGFEALAERVAKVGEPWVTFFEPAALGVDLNRLGFDEIEDLGPSEIAMRYFGAPPGTRLGAGGHVLRAAIRSVLGRR